MTHCSSTYLLENKVSSFWTTKTKILTCFQLKHLRNLNNLISNPKTPLTNLKNKKKIKSNKKKPSTLIYFFDMVKEQNHLHRTFQDEHIDIKIKFFYC